MRRQVRALQPRSRLSSMCLPTGPTPPRNPGPATPSPSPSPPPPASSQPVTTTGTQPTTGVLAPLTTRHNNTACAAAAAQQGVHPPTALQQPVGRSSSSALPYNKRLDNAAALFDTTQHQHWCVWVVSILARLLTTLAWVQNPPAQRASVRACWQATSRTTNCQNAQRRNNLRQYDAKTSASLATPLLGLPSTGLLPPSSPSSPSSSYDLGGLCSSSGGPSTARQLLPTSSASPPRTNTLPSSCTTVLFNNIGTTGCRPHPPARALHNNNTGLPAPPPRRAQVLDDPWACASAP